MAEQNYVRLAAACHCGEPVKLWAGRGRKPKFCDDHGQPAKPDPPKNRTQEVKECPVCRGIFVCAVRPGPQATCCSKKCRLLQAEAKKRAANSEPCSIAGCAARSLVKGLCSKHYQQRLTHGVAGARVQSCQCCGCEFRSERTKMYCSTRCSWTAQDRKAGVRPREEHRNPAHWFRCEECGKDSHRNLSGSNAAKGSRNRWCSMACKLKAGKAARDAAPWPVHRKALCAYVAAHCASCGEAFGSRNPDRTECNGCRQKASRVASAEAGQALHRAAAKVVACQDCGSEYCPLYGAGAMKSCPCCAEVRARSQKRIARNTRKAKQRAVTVESVDPIKVFVRAGWRCYLCGCSTPRELRGTYEANAPELDHVMPLSRGGAHSYANTDCACRACNLEKSDRTLEELLA